MEETYDKALRSWTPHVLHVVAAGEFGGAESQILSLVKGLTQEGEYKVTVVTYYDARFSQKLREAGVACRTLRSGNPLQDKLKLQALVKSVQPDLIHTHGVRASLAGRLVGKAKHIPVVTTIHSDLYYDYASPGKRKIMMEIEQRTRSLSQHFITVSEALKTILIERGYPSDRVSVVHNGIDLEDALVKLEEGQRRKAGLRGMLGLSARTQILICVARLHPVKGHEFLMRAFAAVKQEYNRPLHLVLIGEGSERSALMAKAMELGLYGEGETTPSKAKPTSPKKPVPGRYVHFLGERHDIYSYLLESNIFVLTSKMEALGIALLEGMLAGLPVIATKVGGLKEIVLEGDEPTGILVDYGDEVGLTAAIQTLYDDHTRRRIMGEHGQRRTIKAFEQKQMLKETKAVYAALLQN
ncbi:MAG: glycosyltransferase [Acidibacillus sp.]|nr:glycosyltransferase [Acidibacillus sp.]